MKMWKAGAAFALGLVSALLAAAPPDPLTLLQQTVDATQRGQNTPPIFLSPSTPAARNSRLDAAIHHAFQFLEGWQHQNGSWDRLENPDPAELHEPDGKPLPMTDYDGPIKDQAENDTEEVADTCLSAEAMLLAINSGREIELSPKCLKAIDFLCRQIALWDGDTIYIQKRIFDPVHDPSPSSHEVRYYDSTVDTFFALRVLAEARDHLDDPARKARVQHALDQLLAKIVDRQDINGTWLDESNPISRLPVQKDWKAPIADAPHPAPQYDQYCPNIVTHCLAMNAINLAARMGVAVPEQTRYRAENYLRTALARYDFEKGAPNRNILLMVVVSAEFENDETCRALLDAARKQLKGHAVSSAAADRIHVLETHAAKTREDLWHYTKLMLDLGAISTQGPALDAAPDVLKALQLLSLGGDNSYGGAIERALLRRQKQDGHFSAELDKDFVTRGDNTFGTATSLRILLMLANAPPVDTNDTQP